HSGQGEIDRAGEILERYISEKKPANFSSVVINLAPERSFHSWFKHSDVYTGDFNYTHEHDINDFVQRIESTKLPICDGNRLRRISLTKLTVGQAERFQTRLGVIRYADSVELIADLNDYTSTADLFDLDISMMNEVGTNIE
ncbi:hypothetical protein OSTOST_12477, partial [Ostertagia ostertagi]